MKHAGTASVAFELTGQRSVIAISDWYAYTAQFRLPILKSDENGGDKRGLVGQGVGSSLMSKVLDGRSAR